MHWLVTVKADLEPEKLKDVLSRLGVEETEDLDPVPLDGDAVVEVDGPRDLPDQAAGVPEVVAVHPSSDLTLYE